jgi:hypothetical protein
MYELAHPRRIEKPLNFNNESGPEIITRGDVTMFFISSHAAVNVVHKEKERIFPPLRLCDNLLCEGTPASLKGMFNHGTHAYEKYIVSTFQTKLARPSHIYALEEGCNIFDVTNRYGLDRNEMGAFILLSQYVAPIIKAQDASSLTKAVDEGIKRLLIQDDVSSLDVQKIRKRLFNLNSNKRQLPPDFNDEELASIVQASAHMAIVYMGFLREYEYIGPNIKRYMADLPGKKGIMIGRAHLEAVEKAVENEDFIQPDRWIDFIERIEPMRKNMIVMTRALMTL